MNSFPIYNGTTVPNRLKLDRDKDKSVMNPIGNKMTMIVAHRMKEFEMKLVCLPWILKMIDSSLFTPCCLWSAGPANEWSLAGIFLSRGKRPGTWSGGFGMF